MAAKNRLETAMQLMARRRQKDYEKQVQWNDQTQYYKDFDRYNSKYETWTSSEYYENSASQYEVVKKQQEKRKRLDARREKLRKMLFEEDQEYQMEITESPRNRRSIKCSKLNETPIEVLRDINVGLKLAEDDRRRHEAELKLYHQWKNNNPIIRDYESNNNRCGLKLAWLDQQIEKRMAQEKSEQETKKMIEERNRLIREEEETERLELEDRARKEKKMLQEIEHQMRQYKINENEAERLKRDEDATMRKKYEIEELLAKREEEIRRRKQKEIVLFNINQSKMKLRKKAIDVEEQLQKEKMLIQDIHASQAIEAIQDEENKQKMKNAIQTYMQYVKDQQLLETQRQEYISFIFDSEARLMWQKQEKIWKEEQENRDKLLGNVLTGLKEQIDYKIKQNEIRRRILDEEKEERLKAVNETDLIMKQQKDEMERRRADRKMELDKQINDKRLIEKEKMLEEQKRKLEELQSIKKEEDRLKHELMLMQRGKYHPARFNRRIIW